LAKTVEMRLRRRKAARRSRTGAGTRRSVNRPVAIATAITVIRRASGGAGSTKTTPSMSIPRAAAAS
jgi:hypothetical protein